MAGQLNTPYRTAIRAGGGAHAGHDQYGQITLGVHAFAGTGPTTAKPMSASLSAGGSYSASQTTEEVAGTSLSVAADATVKGPFGVSGEVSMLAPDTMPENLESVFAQFSELGFEATLGTLGGNIGLTATVDETVAAQFTLPGASGLEFNPDTGQVEIFSQILPEPETRFNFLELFGVKEPNVSTEND